jgi:phospholipid/cholesterol/gamma-HCH transport system substrate-binding protein
MMRASNLMIGTTTLAVIAGSVIGFLAVQKIRSVQQRSPLRIVLEGSASGLRKGGSVNFDGVQAGEIISIKLENPRKIVAMIMLDKSAPIRKDTVVGVEFQGLTGVAAISLVGGAPAAPPVPLDQDGTPILTADLSETQSMRDTLHNIDKLLVNNQTTIRDAMLSFESYTASLKGNAKAIDSFLGQSDDALAGVDSTFARIDEAVPGLAHGEAGELLEKLMTLRELADSFKKRAAARMEEGRRTLLDISQAANRTERKINPQAAAPRPPGKPNQNRQ